MLLVCEVSDMAFPYGIVEFKEEISEKPSCAVVATNWLIDIGDTVNYDCYWPPFKTSTKLNKAVESRQQPGVTWGIYRCRVLKKFGKYTLCYTVSDFF